MKLLIAVSILAKQRWARKSYLLVRQSQISKSQKIYGPQIANPQIATFAEGLQIY
jgi:hypothetical protein